MVNVCLADDMTLAAWVREDRTAVLFRRCPSGEILVDVVNAVDAPQRVVYAQVPRCSQRSGPACRFSRQTLRPIVRGVGASEVVVALGASSNGKRPRLAAVLSAPSVSVVVMECWDRVARLEMKFVHATLTAQARQIKVVENGHTTDDLVRDKIEVVSGRRQQLYWRPGARNRTVTAAERELGEGA